MRERFEKLESVQRKFYHADDFDIVGKFNSVRLLEWKRILESHVQSEAVEMIEATYRGQPVIHYTEWETLLNVMTNRDRNYLSGWGLSIAQSENMRLRGKL